jgi:hypothetical protein
VKDATSHRDIIIETVSTYTMPLQVRVSVVVSSVFLGRQLCRDTAT